MTVGPPKTPTATTLALTAGTNPAAIGTPLTFTATVSGGPVSGDVTFYDGLAPMRTVPLDGSFQASMTTGPLAAGAHSITAQYEGDADHASSTSDPIPLAVVDERPATSITLTLSGGTNPSAHGDSLTFAATVTGASPTGEVTFYDREVPIGTDALDDSFRASVTTSTLPSGSRGITAQYAGDANNAPSATAEPYVQIVTPSAGNGLLKVFILAGQSNMQGYGKLEFGRDPDNPSGPEIEDGLGSLRNAVARNPMRYGHLLDPANPVDGKPGWITRDDV